MVKESGARGAIERRRLLERITLLCQIGTGLEGIAIPLCHAIRDLIGADSASVFWLDADRVPEGFYHDSAPAEIKDIFVTRLDELFTVPGEFNMVTMTEGPPAIGRMLEPGATEHFWEGNVQKYLCDPLGHRYLLDMTVGTGDEGLALFCLWNRPEHPFVRADAEALQPVQRLVNAAIANARPDTHWREVGEGSAHFMTDVGGETLFAIDEEAERLLQEGHLLRQGISMAKPMGAAPLFARQLAAMLDETGAATLAIPVPAGRLVARASRSRATSDLAGGKSLMMVILTVEVPAEALAVERLMALTLTPLQREIALFAVRNKPRSECEAEFGVSSEALKKHLRAIYDATGVARWNDLAGALCGGM